MTNFDPQMTLPQVVNIDGQLFYVAPNQSFLAHRQFIQPQIQAQQQSPAQRLVQQQYQLQIAQIQQPAAAHPLQHPAQQHQSPPSRSEPLTPPSPDVVRPQPSPLSKDQTNAKVKNIKEKCISHYIDGQLIIETPKPLREKKSKANKRKKSLALSCVVQQSPQILQEQQHHHQQQQQLQQQQRQQQQRQHLQQHQQPPIHSPHSNHRLADPVASRATTSAQQTPAKGDVAQIRAQMASWTVAQVVEFIESHADIKPYSSKFAEDEIDGRALLLMIDRNLNIQMLSAMFKHGPAMKVEAALSRYKLNE